MVLVLKGIPVRRSHMDATLVIKTRSDGWKSSHSEAKKNRDELHFFLALVWEIAPDYLPGEHLWSYVIIRMMAGFEFRLDRALMPLHLCTLTFLPTVCTPEGPWNGKRLSEAASAIPIPTFNVCQSVVKLRPA